MTATDHTHQRAVAAAGAAFEAGVGYATAPEKAAWIYMRGVSSVRTAALEMEATAALSTRCRDPVYHLIIAYAKHERPTRTQVVNDAERLLSAIGMEDHQYVLAAHMDTDDFHAHVIANRVGSDGRANDLWHEQIIRERVCAEISAERGWGIVVGRHNRDIVQRTERLHSLPPEPDHRLSDGAYRRLHEHGELPWQDAARPYILESVDRARGWSDLHRHLAAHGVVVKQVRRGERVQGLAFAEGHDPTAPGCGASRIDARCALLALERRFGPFTPSNGHNFHTGRVERSTPAEPVGTRTSSLSWSDEVRPTIRAAVNEARSWPDLTQRLGQQGIAIKVVERGGRVQGLAFAKGMQSDAPGCGASRIDPCCRKAALEQRFGPFPREEQRPPERARDSKAHPRGAREHKAARLCKARENSRPQPSATKANRAPHVRKGAERDASDPGGAVRQPGHIIDHARMRSAYMAHRERFVDKRHGTNDARRNAAWESERIQRQLEGQRRREARQLLRAVARLGTRGLLARKVAYWSIDGVVARRRAREYNAARVRWQATKIVLDSERGLEREKRLMDYRSFVIEKTRTGNQSAQRVLDGLKHRQRNQEYRASLGEPRPMSLNEVRARLEVIRTDEEARFERARVERKSLQRVGSPRSLEDVLAAERKRIREQAAEATTFTDAERAGLAQFAEAKRSWNPLARAVAANAEAELRVKHHSRYEKRLAEATREFEGRDVPQLLKRVAADQGCSRQYVTASLALEKEMREARAVLRDRLPRVERSLSILERAAVLQLSIADAPNLKLNEIAAATYLKYKALPEVMRRDAERSIRREKHPRGQSRDSISIGDR